MKTYITAEIFNDSDQKILIQPSPEFNGIEIYTSEEDGSHQSRAFYINPSELRVITEELQRMMNYVTNKTN